MNFKWTAFVWTLHMCLLVESRTALPYYINKICQLEELHGKIKHAHVHVLPSVTKNKFLLTILTQIQIKRWCQKERRRLTLVYCFNWQNIIKAKLVINVWSTEQRIDLFILEWKGSGHLDIKELSRKNQQMLERSSMYIYLCFLK